MINYNKKHHLLVIAGATIKISMLPPSVTNDMIFAHCRSNGIETKRITRIREIEIRMLFQENSGHRSIAPSVEWIVESGGISNEKFKVERNDIAGMVLKHDTGVSADWTIFHNHPAQIHSVVKMTLAYALSFENKLLLHCSGVIRNRKLFLFVGPSGCGKSTISMQLNGGGIPFCTDRAVITARDNPPIAFPTPFSDFKNVCLNLEPSPPAALVFIEQADEHALCPLSPCETGRGILQNVQFIPGSPRLIQATLDTASEIAESVPGLHLRFRKDEGFWPLLDSWNP